MNELTRELSTGAGLFHFLFVTVALGGLAAYATGRAVARDWGGFAQIFLYMIPLTFATRFLHYALFEEAFLSAAALGVTFAYLSIVAIAAFRRTRSAQLRQQYGWLTL